MADFGFGFLDLWFGGGGDSAGSGAETVSKWAIGQALASAGPVGQYLGLAVYGVHGTGIPIIVWGTNYDENGQPPDQNASTDAHRTQESSTSDSAPSKPADSAPSKPAESRTLEALDRGNSESAPSQAKIDVVNVFGHPREKPSGNDWWPGFETYLASQGTRSFSGPEIQIRWADPPPIRPPRPRRPAARNPSPVDPLRPAPEQPRPERDPVDSGPYFNSDVAPSTVPYSDRAGPSWMSDASVPEQTLPWGSWERPENMPSPRSERDETGRIETGRIETGRVETGRVETVERSFWNRGGTGLAAGAVTAGIGLAVVFWWCPVGWVAGASVALAIAGGITVTTASTVELVASYGGATSAKQDADTNRAIAAALGYSSIGGVLGGVGGAVLADDAPEGFAEGALWGGLFEGAASLPGAMRALPGLWNAARPWAKSLLLTPFWFFTSAGGGGGNARSLARVFAAQGRIASRVRRVEYLGTTPLLERYADWARFQVFATGTRQEGVFRITYTNGQQRIVLADSGLQGGRSILEAKKGDLGQMFNATREAHIIRQANNYLDITTATGGNVGYLVSTELGASRLAQRFGREFPAETASGQLWIDWVPWRRR